MAPVGNMQMEKRNPGPQRTLGSPLGADSSPGSSMTSPRRGGMQAAALDPPSDDQVTAAFVSLARMVCSLLSGLDFNMPSLIE